MIVHLPSLLVGLLLLWMPRSWLRRGAAFFKRRRRRLEPWNVREAGDPRVSFRIEFGKLRNFIDLLRAAGGTLLLGGGFGVIPAILVEADASRAAATETVAVRAAVLVVGVGVQMLRFEKRRLSFFPPIFYLAGTAMGLCDVRAALFAFALTWAVNAALPNARAFLAVFAVLIVGFGHLFAKLGDVDVLLAGFLALLPALASLLANRPLTILARKPRAVVRS